MRVDGSRIRKEKFADSKISGYVWTGPKAFEDGNSENCVNQFAVVVATPSIFLILKHSLVEPVLKMAHYTNKLICSGCTVLTNDKLTQR